MKTTKQAGWTDVSETCEPEAPGWSAPLPRRRARWRAWPVLGVSLVAGLAFGAGRLLDGPDGRAALAGSVAPARADEPGGVGTFRFDLDVNEDAFDAEEVARSVALERLVDLAGARVLTVRADHPRWLTAAYEVGDLLAEPPPPPWGCGGHDHPGEVVTVDDDAAEPHGIDVDKLVEIVESKLGESDDHRVGCHGGVLVVRGTLAVQTKVSRLIARMAVDLERP